MELPRSQSYGGYGSRETPPVCNAAAAAAPSSGVPSPLGLALLPEDDLGPPSPLPPSPWPSLAQPAPLQRSQTLDFPRLVPLDSCCSSPGAGPPLVSSPLPPPGWLAERSMTAPPCVEVRRPRERQPAVGKRVKSEADPDAGGPAADASSLDSPGGSASISLKSPGGSATLAAAGGSSGFLGVSSAWRCGAGGVSEEERPAVCAQVRQHPVCALLASADVDCIVDCMHLYSFEAGEVLARQDDVGHHFCVLRSGALDVFDSTGAAVSALRPGAVFGGSALLFESPKRVTIVARSACSVWAAEGNSFREVLYASAQNSFEENLSFLDSINLFAGLSEEQKRRVGQLAFYSSCHEAGARIITEGNPVAATCFVKRGQLDVITGGQVNSDGQLVGGVVVSRLKEGDSFGKRAGTQDMKSKVSVVAVSRCVLVCVGVEQMKALLGNDLAAALERAFILKCLEKSRALSPFSLMQKRHIVSAMEFRDYGPSETLEPLPEFAVLLSGGLQGFHAGGESASRGDGDADGAAVILDEGALIETDEFVSADEGLLPKKRSSRSLVASTSRQLEGVGDFRKLLSGSAGARLATLTRAQLDAALMELGIESHTEAAMEQARRTLLARKVPIFHHLSKAEIERVVQSFYYIRLERHATVYERGPSPSDLWVVVRGEVEELEDGQRVRVLGWHRHFGERPADAAMEPQRRSSYAVRVLSEEAELWQLEREDFDQLVTGRAREDLRRRAVLRDTPVSLRDLRQLRVLGFGAFGSVRLVSHRRCRELRYALKRVRRQQRGKVMEFLEQECSLLAELDHPMILQLVRTFETSSSTYLLTELLTGGELLDALNRIGRSLTRPEAQFYAGSLVLALEHLHDRGIVYRDLKPENAMLDHDGYLRLIDFGTAKRLDAAGARGRTYTIVGSYHFMAPEVTRGHGYGVEVDIWSLGVMLFEFVCGYLPFGSQLEDSLEICRAVQHDNLVFPEWYSDSVGRHLLRAMLRRDPARRLASGPGGIEELKQHEFFIAHLPAISLDEPEPRGLFEALLTRDLEPPLAPASFASATSAAEAEDPTSPSGTQLSDASELADG
eukprot:TRINITY_DN31373_c0_g1_i1.p1 TRINITY_DN31373_c0_g1~~TRINITY_DN31373_c0_g1_i1.p1  ORF type:complete len:1073 (-),score=263.64 TRINITY_DN31373_c0_g1_i1:70-3288(-)